LRQLGKLQIVGQLEKLETDTDLLLTIRKDDFSMIFRLHQTPLHQCRRMPLQGRFAGRQPGRNIKLNNLLSPSLLISPACPPSHESQRHSQRWPNNRMTSIEETNSLDFHASNPASALSKEADASAQACMEKPLPPLPDQRKRRSTWSWIKGPVEPPSPTVRKRQVTLGNTLKRMLGLESSLEAKSVKRITFDEALEITREQVLQLLATSQLRHADLQVPLERVLIVDVRNAESFAQGHILGSINCNVPSMFLKRARKNPKANKFHLESFLNTPECKDTLNRWIEATKDNSRVVIVLDEDMSIEKRHDLKGDGWATLMLISRALQGDKEDQGLISPDGLSLAYLIGGWNGFAASNFVASSLSRKPPVLSVNPPSPNHGSINLSTTPATGETMQGSPLSGTTLQGTPIPDHHSLLSVTSSTAGSMFKIDTTRTRKRRGLTKQASGSMPAMRTSRLSIQSSLATIPGLVVHTFANMDKDTPKSASEHVDSAATAVHQFNPSPLIVNTVQVPSMELSVTPASPVREMMEHTSLSTIQSGTPALNRANSLSSVSIRIDYRKSRSSDGLLTSPPAKSPSCESVLYSPSSASPSGSSTPGSGGDDEELRSGKSAPAACTQVLPNVFIGSEEMVAGVHGLWQLRHIGVTHILNVATEVHSPDGFVVGVVQGVEEKPTFRGYKRMEIRDHANEAMEGYLREAIDWLGTFPD